MKPVEPLSTDLPCGRLDDGTCVEHGGRWPAKCDAARVAAPPDGLREAALNLCRFAGRFVAGDIDVERGDVQTAIDEVRALATTGQREGDWTEEYRRGPIRRGRAQPEVRAADPGGLPCNDDFYCGQCPDCLANPDLANRATPATTCGNCGRRLYARIWVRCPDCAAVLTPEATAPGDGS